MTKFKLLLKNPILDTYSHVLLEEDYISKTIGYKLAIPDVKNKPFVFSCFASSIDGKLYYPDNKTGFSIAKSNSHAIKEERKADIFILMLGRSIADAVIVGTNSLNNEKGNFLPDITNSELKNIRYKYTGSNSLTTFIICRDLSNINFTDKLLSNNSNQVVICCINNHVDQDKIPDTYAQLNFATLKNRKDLKLKNILRCDTLDHFIAKMHEIGFNIILNESPYCHHKLLKSKLLDEIWLNYSGSYIGGTGSCLGSTLTPFESNNHPDCELLTLHTLGYNFIYTRQRILY
ncbi:MAG: hypothetical protein K0R14_275 [Burkholderiales bacterium]|nr:hypothetical protein [Burkholderiales bacterium]